MPLPLLYTALSATLISADPLPPAAAADDLPPPRVVIIEPAYPNYYRRSAYDVWQTVGVAQDMSWQPLVRYAPGYGYYYVSNGKPYLYAPIYQRWVSPSIQGTPYRSLPQLPPPVILWEEEVLPQPKVAPEAEKPVEAKPTSVKKAKPPVPKMPPREEE